MSRILSGAVVVAGLVLGSPGAARAAEVTVGDGIAVVELTADEGKEILGAVDSAAAFAGAVSPLLPPEYRVLVKVTAGGWAALRKAGGRDGLPLRVVLTAVPPAVLLLPRAGMTAEDVIALHARFREKAAGYARAALKDTVGAAADRLDAARRELAGHVSTALLLSELRDRGAPGVACHCTGEAGREQWTVVKYPGGPTYYRPAAVTSDRVSARP
jgi:hypothetical protein